MTNWLTNGNWVQCNLGNMVSKHRARWSSNYGIILGNVIEFDLKRGVNFNRGSLKVCSGKVKRPVKKPKPMCLSWCLDKRFRFNLFLWTSREDMLSLVVNLSCCKFYWHYQSWSLEVWGSSRGCWQRGVCTSFWQHSRIEFNTFFDGHSSFWGKMD